MDSTARADIEKRITNKRQVVFILSMIFATSIVVNTSAIGVSPGLITINNTVPEGYVEKTLAISTAGKEDLTLKIEAGGEIKDWITFEPNESQIILPKKSAKQVLVKIAIPSKAQKGEYEGEVIISTIYKGNLSGNVSGALFMPGLIVKIQLTITGMKVLGYEVNSISVKDTEQDYPVEFTVTASNTGNAVVTPRLHFTMLNDEGKEIGRTFDYSETAILPTTSKQFSVWVPTKGMKIGDYYANVTSDLGYEQLLFFHILTPGTYLIVRGELEQISLDKTWVKPEETVEVNGTFINDGQRFINSAKLKCESYVTDPTYGTRELVGISEGKPRNASVGEKITLSAYVTPPTYGKYSIECLVLYDGKRTGVKSKTLNVEEPVRHTLLYDLITLLINRKEEVVTISLITIALFIYYWNRRAKYRASRLRGGDYTPPVEKPTTPIE